MVSKCLTCLAIITSEELFSEPKLEKYELSIVSKNPWTMKTLGYSSNLDAKNQYHVRTLAVSPFCITEMQY